MKVVLKLNNKLSTGIASGATSKGLWGAIQGEIVNQKDLVEYIDEKILGVDHTEYVTEEELEGKGYLTEIPEEYITSEELNAKGYLTEHQDISTLATKEELSGYQVAGDYLTEIPEDYAKKTDIPDTSSFITEDQLESKGYLTEVTGYVTNEEFNTTLGDIEAVLDEIIGEVEA